MEPKIEQPKQYTPEEVAQLEKSRTISDAELLKNGAEYVINRKGEVGNLLVTSDKKAIIHSDFKREEGKELKRRQVKEKEEHKKKREELHEIEQREDKPRESSLFVAKMGNQIRKRLEVGDLVTVMSAIYDEDAIKSLNEEQASYVNNIVRAWKDGDLSRFFTDGITCRQCFVRSVVDGGDKELAQQILTKLGGHGTIEEGNWRVAGEWA